MRDLTVGEAAAALGVSADTVRRWDRSGKLQTRRDARNRRVVPAAEVQRLTSRPVRTRPPDRLSARNRFPGVVTSVEVDGVMALVEIEAANQIGERAGVGDGPAVGRDRSEPMRHEMGAGVGRGEARGRVGREAEPAIVARIAEHEYERKPPRAGELQAMLHERLSETSALPARQD